MGFMWDAFFGRVKGEKDTDKGGRTEEKGTDLFWRFYVAEIIKINLSPFFTNPNPQ